MICPHCNAVIEDGRSVCPVCKEMIHAGASSRACAANPVVSGMSAIRQARFQDRVNAMVSENQLVSARTYNFILLGVVLWGLLCNVLICYYVGDVYRFGVSSLVSLLIFFGMSIAGVKISRKSTKPGVSFLGYHLVVLPFGLLISTAVAEYGGVSDPVVAEAFLYTLLVTGGMTALSLAFPKLFSRLGGVLLGLLGGVLLCEIVMLFLGRAQPAFDWIIAVIFGIYVGYDVYRAQQFPKTVDNAVDSALDIYMDIANLFLRILAIMTRSKNDD